MPDQTFDTIGDRFSEKGLDWAWYSGGWNDAQLGGDAASPDVIDQFQYHHQPFVYFAKYADGTAAKAAHLKDEQDFLALAKTGPERCRRSPSSSRWGSTTSIPVTPTCCVAISTR